MREEGGASQTIFRGRRNTPDDAQSKMEHPRRCSEEDGEPLTVLGGRKNQTERRSPTRHPMRHLKLGAAGHLARGALALRLLSRQKKELEEDLARHEGRDGVQAGEEDVNGNARGQMAGRRARRE